MFHGYLAIGDNEIGNNARAAGYQRTSDCPILWIRKEGDCESLAEALFDAPYVYDSIDQAPWYDPDDPDTTSRFLGGYIVSISGLSDSTITVHSNEKLTAGSVVTGSRHASREVRVRMFLTARGMDAMEVGMTWLSNALTARDCGTHGAACGMADLQFFVSCPPERGSDLVLSDWAGPIVNRAVNPSFESDVAIPPGAERSNEWSVRGGYSLFIPYPETQGYGDGPYGHGPYGN